jgi:hypothetical protein
MRCGSGPAKPIATRCKEKSFASGNGAGAAINQKTGWGEYHGGTIMPGREAGCVFGSGGGAVCAEELEGLDISQHGEALQ